MPKPMYDVHEIINYILSNYSVSNKKLQKLLYFTYSWIIALFNDSADQIEFKLFAESPQAWVHGPAFHNVYTEYKKYGWEDIPMIKRTPSNISNDVRTIIDRTLDCYAHLTADDLESLSHMSDPWIKARGNLDPFESSSNIIDDRDIFIYFNKLYQEDDKERKQKRQRSNIYIPTFSS